MSLCDSSFDSAMDSEATVSIQAPFFPSKDVWLLWKVDLEHLLRKKRTFTLDLQIFSGGEFPQPLFQWLVILTGTVLFSHPHFALYF